MSLSLPGIYLYYLPNDNLAPEEFERIISAHRAWSRICREYVFDEGYGTGRYIINMREDRTVQHRTASRGLREKDKLEKMVFSGDVVMLSDIYGPANLFYINEGGKLVCTDPMAFRFEGAKKIIAQYDQSVLRRDYRTTNGKPRPTPMNQFRRGESPVQAQAPLRTINSANTGRLLAAGGVYNQNPEMFADTAKKLGGDAAKGFDQVLNEKTAGAAMAASALLGARKGGAASVEQFRKLKNISAKKTGNVDSATSSLQSSKLNDYYRQAEKYGQDGIKELENGRFRFYGTITPARTSGEMAGARLVREWEPKSGQTRTWYETVDHAGNIRSVAPKPVTSDKNHRIFDTNGNYQGRR